MRPAATRAIEAGLARIMPAHARGSVLAIDPRHAVDLRPTERSAVAAAVPARRDEFATGRALLRELTRSTDAIAVGSNRAPSLPDGWVGSLAHTARFAVAVVAPSTALAALGIDLEPAGHMSPEESAIVLRADDPPIDARAALVLKEAAYKAWSALGGRLIDFHDVRLVLGEDQDRFAAIADDTRLHGRWTDAGGHWLALVSVSH